MTPEMLIHAEVVRLIWRALEQRTENRLPIRVFAEALFDVGANRNRTRRPDLAGLRRRSSYGPGSNPGSGAHNGGGSHLSQQYDAGRLGQGGGILRGWGATGLAGNPPTSPLSLRCGLTGQRCSATAIPSPQNPVLARFRLPGDRSLPPARPARRSSSIRLCYNPKIPDQYAVAAEDSQL